MRFHPGGDTELQLDSLLNEGLGFRDNFRGAILEVDLDEGKNEIQHGLGFTPIGYIVLYKRENGDIFGTEADQWTAEKLFLKSSVTNQRARLLVV